MGGLLYKDFVAINGKKIVWILSVLTVAFILLRMLLPGSEDAVDLTDNFFCLGEFLIIWMGCYIINTWGAKIVRFDEKNKVHGYLFSMPVEKRTYVASKFVFIGISTYVFFSLYMVWHIVSLSFMANNYNKDLSYLLASFAIPFVSTVLFVTELELLLYLIIGRVKTKIIKEGGIMLIAFLVLAYLLFGNLNILASWDFVNLIKWANAHAFFLTLLSILFPLVVLSLCYVFYRIAAKLYQEKEDIDA